METVTITETGCYLDNHRGHYITRDVVELAVEYGFIIGPCEQYVVDMYSDDTYGHTHEGYPHEAVIELCDDAIDWLNSGQTNCVQCLGTGMMPASGNEAWRDKDGVWRCKACTGTGRGSRVAGQNFPPVIPDDYVWGFNDGDFGLYEIEEEN